MTRTPQKSIDLRARIADPGYTPGLRDVAGLVALLADESTTTLAARALGRLQGAGAPAWDAVAAFAREGRGPVRAGVLDVLAQLDAAKATPLAVEMLVDDDPKVRRRAISALGRHASAEGETALLAAYSAPTTSPAHKRAIATSLGKMGGPRALELLRTLTTEGATADDAELTRIARQAHARRQRDDVRTTPSRIRGDVVAPAPLTVRYRVRRGLEALLVEELVSGGHRGARIEPGKTSADEAHVTMRWTGTLGEALAAARTAYALTIPLSAARLASSQGGDDEADEDLVTAIVRTLTSADAKAKLTCFTEGPIRFRLALEGAGHQRALMWKVAGVLAADPSTSWLVNDAREAPWEAVARRDGGKLLVDLEPRALADERFAYRAEDVPAASHPPLAAALARVAGVRAEDVVWDPFVGSGTELVERARLGDYARLYGSDRDASAVAAAERNLARAGVARATLRVADVFTPPPPGVTVILTNPPMGRRVQGALDLTTLLDRFVLRAAEVLAKPGSRLVWLSPQPKRTRARLEAEGLVLARSLTVDMGGFDAELQRYDRM